MSDGNLLSRMDVFGVTSGGRLRKASKLLSEGRLVATRDTDEARSRFQESKSLLQTLPIENDAVRTALGEACLELGHLERLKGDAFAAVESLLEAQSHNAALTQGDRDFIATQFALVEREDETAVSIYLDTISRWAKQVKPASIRPVFEILERLCYISSKLSDQEAIDRLVFCQHVLNADDETPFPYFYRGVHFFLGGNYLSAHEEFREAQDRESAAPELGYYLNFSAGQNARQQNDLPGAAGYFIEAVRRYPQLFAPNYEAGVCLVQLCESNAEPEESQKTPTSEDIEANRRAFACNALGRACHLDPTSSDAWSYLGRAFYLDQNWAEASEAFEKAVSLDPSPDLYLALARSLKKQEKQAPAIAAARKAVELNPEFGAGNRFIAQAAYESGDMEAAANEYRAILTKAEAAGETDEDSLAGLATCLYDQKQYGEVARLLTPIQDSIPPQTKLILARSLSLEKDFEHAEACYLQLATQEPENGRHYYYLGTCRAHQEKYEEALEAFALAAACKEFPENLPLQKGYVLETLERFPEAEASYRSAIQESEPTPDESNEGEDSKPESVPARPVSEATKRIACYRLGMMALKAKRNDDAISWLGMATPNLETLLALAQAHEQGGHPASADEMYLRAIQEHPDNLAPQVRFGCALARRSDWERAIGYLREAIKKGDITEAAYYHLGMAYIHSEKYVNALNYLDKLPRSARLNETLCTLCLRAARQSREEGSLDLAIEYWQRAIRYGGSEVVLKAEIGKAHLALGVRKAQAGEPVFQWQAEMMKAEKYIPQEPNLQFALAVLDLCSARTTDCLRRLESVQYVLEPHLQPCADYLTAMAYLQQGESEKAETIFTHLTALSQRQPLPFDPDYPHACLLAERNKWEEAAKVLYSRVK